MKKLSWSMVLIMILIECGLIYYYFSVLLPHYNNSIIVIGPDIVPTENSTCSSFKAHKEAQEFYNKNISTYPHLSSLDKDKDGVVCENLL